MNNNKLYGILGLARKAGSLESGLYSIKSSLQKRPGYLLLLAEDAGLNTHKKITDLSINQGVPLLVWGKKEEFSKIFNRPVAALLITSKDFVHPFYHEGGNLKS